MQILYAGEGRRVETVLDGVRILGLSLSALEMESAEYGNLN